MNNNNNNNNNERSLEVRQYAKMSSSAVQLIKKHKINNKI